MWRRKRPQGDLTEAERRIYDAVSLGDLMETGAWLRRLKEPLEWRVAQECLLQGLYACPELFALLLEHCPDIEYSGRVEVRDYPWRSSAEGDTWSLQGTLVTLAAGLNKPRHLAMLLDRGMDINSASLRAGEALLRLNNSGGHREYCGPLPGGPKAGPASVLELGGKDFHPGCMIPALAIHGVTPLAAAVAMGSVECVELLLERGGAWLTECPAVSMALLLPCRDWNEKYRRGCRLVRTYGLGPGQERKLLLWAAASVCTARQLREETGRHSYTREEMADAAASILHGRSGLGVFMPDESLRERFLGKLELLERLCPEVLRLPENHKRLLLALLSEPASGWEELLEFVARTCGETADLTLAGSRMSFVSQSWLSRVLRTLSGHCCCVMDRDAVPMELGNSPNALRLLVRYVSFLPPACAEGVSGLTYALMASGDLRLFRRALEKDLIPAEESTALLLRCQREMGMTPMLRSLLLTGRRTAAGAPELPRLNGGPERWFPEAGNYQPSPELWSALLLDPACSERTERKLVLLERNIREIETVVEIKLAQNFAFQTQTVRMMLSVLGRTNTLLACAGLPGFTNTEELVIHYEDELVTLQTTPLCAAAVAGQGDTVRALLALGLDPDERDLGRPSQLQSFAGSMPLTPLLAALLCGHWDTARTLIEWGAVYDLRDPMLGKLQRRWWTETAPEEVVSHLGDLISPEGVLCA